MSTDFNSSKDELNFAQTLRDRQVRRVYLITSYSEAYLVEFSTCRIFVGKELEFFTKQKDHKNPAFPWVLLSRATCRWWKTLTHGYTFRKTTKKDAY